MTLLICPVRPGDDNPEFRFALRSWEQNLVLSSGMALMTVGYCPSWLNPDQHVGGNRHASSNANIWDNIRLGSAAADESWASPEVIYMNDDFFCLDPTPGIVPVRRDMTLAEHIALYPQYQSMWWPRSLALTASTLEVAGFPNPWSYEVHRPLLASPRAMSEALAHWQGGLEGDIPQWRTLYGVLNDIEAHPVGDGKLGIPGLITSPWVSTSDLSWRKHGRFIAGRFQKPSRWER